MDCLNGGEKARTILDKVGEHEFETTRAKFSQDIQGLHKRGSQSGFGSALAGQRVVFRRPEQDPLIESWLS